MTHLSSVQTFCGALTNIVSAALVSLHKVSPRSYSPSSASSVAKVLRLDALRTLVIRGNLATDSLKLCVPSLASAREFSSMKMVFNPSWIISNSIFPNVFAEDEHADQLGLDNVSELIKSVGATPAGGRFIVTNNVFGTNSGHNDVIDVDSGRLSEVGSFVAPSLASTKRSIRKFFERPATLKLCVPAERV